VIGQVALDGDAGVIRIHIDDPVTNRKIYEIDLDRCRDASDVLNWIYQIMGKNWATPEIMFELLKTFEEAGVAYRR
jgi:hypothetical protein